jgi:hypothetical protein
MTLVKAMSEFLGSYAKKCKNRRKKKTIKQEVNMWASGLSVRPEPRIVPPQNEQRRLQQREE